ncbi:MAG: alkaline phosphatase family protein [Candidatus Eisenbacteria bacterium]
MASRIGRAWLLALFALLWVSLFAGLAALGLNERFVDSAAAGWRVFLLAPIAGTIPMAIVAFLFLLLPGPDEKIRAGRFLGFTALVAVLPVTVLPLYGKIAALLAGSPVLTVLLVALAAFLLALGAFRVGRFLAVRLCPGGRPRTLAWALPLALLAALPPAGAWLSARPIAFDDRPRTLILCVDGATWKLADEMEDRLPTFRALQERGTRFDLQSESPLMSPILWTSIASGVSPSEHGVTSFYVSSANVAAPRLWDMAEERGLDVGILGWPITWPPRPINGFMIPSLFARGPETYPEELQFIREVAMMEKGKRKRELDRYSLYGIRMVQYGVKLSTLIEAGRVVTMKGDFLEKMSAQRFLKLRIHSDLFVELWDRYRPALATFYNNGIDVTCHYFWKYFEPGGYPQVTAEEAERYGRMIPDIYAAMDRALGKILHYAPEHLNILVVSDHGLQGMAMEDSGTIRLIRTENFLRRLGLENAVDGVNLASRVHLKAKRGRGFPPGLANFIEDVTVEGTGESAFVTGVDETGGIIVNVAPGVVLGGKSLLVPGREPCPAGEIVEETDARISGEHNIYAILLAVGDQTPAGARGGLASIYDVAPTALYMMELPVGENMRGRVLERAFRDGYLRDHPPSYTTYRAPAAAAAEEDAEADEVLREQLRALGYLN